MRPGSFTLRHTVNRLDGIDWRVDQVLSSDQMKVQTLAHSAATDIHLFLLRLGCERARCAAVSACEVTRRHSEDALLRGLG